MKLKSLRIHRTESYQTPANTLVGLVELINEEQGAMQLRLSNATLMKICELCQADVTRQAQLQARAAAESMADASSELALGSNPFVAIEAAK